MLTHIFVRTNQMKKPTHKKTQNFHFVITMAIIITTNFNCISSMLKYEMKRTPGDYRLLVHENPKEGDYSVYKSISEHGTWLTYYYKIEKIENDEIYIRKGHLEASWLISAFKDIYYIYKTDMNGYSKEASIKEIEDIEESKLEIANPKGTDFVLSGNTYNYKFTDFECLKDTYKASNDLVGEKDFKICYNALHKVKSSGGIETFQVKIYLTHPSIFFQVAEIYTMTISSVGIPLFFKSAESYIKAVIINEDNKIRLKYEANMTTKLIKTGNGIIDE